MWLIRHYRFSHENRGLSSQAGHQVTAWALRQKQRGWSRPEAERSLLWWPDLGGGDAPWGGKGAGFKLRTLNTWGAGAGGQEDSASLTGWAAEWLRLIFTAFLPEAVPRACCDIGASFMYVSIVFSLFQHVLENWNGRLQQGERRQRRLCSCSNLLTDRVQGGWHSSTSESNTKRFGSDDWASSSSIAFIFFFPFSNQVLILSLLCAKPVPDTFHCFNLYLEF